MQPFSISSSIGSVPYTQWQKKSVADADIQRVFEVSQGSALHGSKNVFHF